MDLFEFYKMGEFTEFPVLPEELVGVDIEPDDLPPINVEANRVYEYVEITYEVGESQLMNDFVGYNFLGSNKNSFYFSDLMEKKDPKDKLYENKIPDYVLILFRPEEVDQVVKRFNLPYYTKNNKFKLKDLMSYATMQF